MFGKHKGEHAKDRAGVFEFKCPPVKDNLLGDFLANEEINCDKVTQEPDENINVIIGRSNGIIMEKETNIFRELFRKELLREC